MGYCNHPHCSTPIIKSLNGVHGFLCNKSERYHSWHHHPRHKEIHLGTLAVYIVTIFGLLFSSFFPSGQALAANQTANWNMTTSSEYTYDSNSIEFSAGIAQLKAAYTPGTDWIATDGGYNWGKRKNITLSNTGGGAQTNYQILVTTDTTGGDFQSDCDDIRFTNSDGKTNLDYWLEPNTCNTATTKLWVEADSIAAPPSTTTIYIYYNNAFATATSSIANTFIREVSGLRAAWNMDEANGVSISDSSGNANTGTAQRDTTTTGKFGNARSFNGTSDYIEAANSDTVRNNGTGAWTAEAWVYPTSKTDHSYHTIMAKQYSPGFWFGLYANTTQIQTWLNAGARVNPTEVVQLNQWNHIVSSYSAGTLTVYVNNVAATPITGIGSTLTIGTDTLRIGMDREGGTPNYFFTGSIDDVRLYNTALSSTEVSDIYNNFAYSTTNYPGKSMVRKRAATEPAISNIASAITFYPTTNPTLVPSTGQGYSSLVSFTETLGASSAGTIKYQISPNGGTTWYWYTASAWTVTSAGYTEANTSTDVNSNIATFTAGSAPKTFKWRAYLNSDGSQQPKIDNLALEYVWDTADPDNPASVTGLSGSGGSALTTNTWYNYSAPYFSWSAPSDNAGVGETASGIAGYYVYLGTTATADPYTSGSYQTGVTYTASSLSSASTYYLRIETKDSAGNIKHIAGGDASLFIYKYDVTAPTSPVYVSVSPSGYTRTNSFMFAWPTTGANAAVDTGGSALAGYQYKTAVSSGALSNWSSTVTGGSVEIADAAYQTGTNVFYLRAIDTAGNVDATPVQTNYYYNASASSAPVSLAVTPLSSDSNSFAFSWGIPAIYNGSIAGYYYSINALPTITNTTYTTATSLAAGSYATQQGENTLYLVAKDESGNYDFSTCSNISGNTDVDGCAKISFTANTSAPGIPTAVQIFDISNRDTGEYAISLKWTAPVSKGTGFNGYTIYRSINNSTFTSVASNDGSGAGVSFTDTGLSAQLYYYYVKSKDNAGQSSAVSTTVSITPTGRYTNPPTVTVNPTVITKAFSAITEWRTNREASSFVYVIVNPNPGKTCSSDILKNVNAKGQPEKTLIHTVAMTGLEPSTEYCLQTMWEDQDGNQGKSSSVLTFTTKERPSIDLPKADNITLNSATISWTSKTIINTTVSYCPNTAGSICGQVKDYSGLESESHTVQLYNLTDGTKYLYQITGTDIDGNSVASSKAEFTTLTKPKVLDLRFESIKDAPTTSLKFVWTTNVPTTSIITYQSGSGVVKSKSEADLKKDHEISVNDLADKATYILQAKGVDEFGNQCESDKNTFTTPDDTRPPKLTNLAVEVKSSGFGSDQKAQIIVTWETDEPASSQIEYAQGIEGKEYSNKSKEDSALPYYYHAVIISELDPSKIYHLRAVSRDASGNPGYSNDTTTITGKSQQNVLDIIMGSLQKSLGWVFKVFN